MDFERRLCGGQLLSRPEADVNAALVFGPQNRLVVGAGEPGEGWMAGWMAGVPQGRNLTTT
jgi:hypothetical protein